MKPLTLRLTPFRRLIFAALLASGSFASGQVTVTWQAIGDFGIGDSLGTPVATGSLVKLGRFLVDNNAIQTHAGDYAFLSANFVTFDTTTIGSGDAADGVDGYWFRVSPSTSADTLGVAGQRMYLWAFNSASGATATEQGIFTSDSWLFPGDNDAISFSVIELDGVDSIIIGSLGSTTFNLAAIPAAVPEPAATTMLAGAAALALVCGRGRFHRIRSHRRLPLFGKNEIAGSSPTRS